ANIDLVQLPYKSAGPAVIALLSGEVSLSLLPGLTVLPQVKAGRLRALAITSVKRAPALSDLPTVAESGLPGFEASQWYGVLAPAGTAPPILDLLNSQIVKIMRTPEMKSHMTADGLVAIGSSREEFAAHIKAETEKWARVIRA